MCAKFRLDEIARGSYRVLAKYDRLIDGGHPKAERCQPMDLINSGQASVAESKTALYRIHNGIAASGMPTGKDMGDGIRRFDAWPGGVNWPNGQLYVYVFEDQDVAADELARIIVAGADLVRHHDYGQRETRGLEIAQELHVGYWDAKLLGQVEIDERQEPIGGKRDVN